ncbi:MAG: hypothetical protein ACW96X_05865 [Promethearchaeota archaeon]
MKAIKPLELALGRPHSLMLQLSSGDGCSTEGWVYVSSVSLIILLRIIGQLFYGRKLSPF